MKLFFCLVFSWFAVATSLIAQVQSTLPTTGLHESKPSWTVIENATIHVSPNKVVEKGQILIHGETIEAVGESVAEPSGSLRIDAAGKHVYAGFIDAYFPISASEESTRVNQYWNTQINSAYSMADTNIHSKLPHDDLRKAGFAAVLLAPEDGIINGTSAVYLTNRTLGDQALVRPNVGMHMLLTTRFRGRGRSEGGPTSPMGAYALARQTMYDADWYRNAHRIAQSNPGVQRPETNTSLQALQPALNGEMPVIINTSNEIFSLRASRFAKEFGLRLYLIGSGNEYRRLDEIAALQVPIVLPIDFPEAPSLKNATEVLDASLESLMDWDHAPENPSRLAQAGVRFALTSEGMDKKSEFLNNLRTAVKRGLSETVALEALTTVPADLLNVSQSMGSIEKGKLANLVVTDKPLFAEKAKIVESWVAGDRSEFDADKNKDLSGEWQVTGAANDIYLNVATEPKLKITIGDKPASKETANDDEKEAVEEDETKEEEGKSDDQQGDQGNESDDTKSKADENSKKERSNELKAASLENGQLSGQFEDEKLLGQGGTGVITVHFDSPTTGFGMLILPDGNRQSLSVKKSETPESSETEVDEADDSKGNRKKDDQDDAETQGASFAVNYPFGDFGRNTLPTAPGSVLFTNVNVWTLEQDEVIENGAVLIENGLIAGVFASGENLPDAEVVVDGNGMHLTPGLIDCHSHMATDSGVNEVGQAITAEVRIGDFIDCDDITIYRQLSGGLTSSNILHGSANPIGGQNQVIKLRWGLNDEQMKFAEAPSGIKFALGENVKQSNRREPSDRYPQTRMGVEQIMHDTFRAAIEYQKAHAEWKANRNGLPPRIDLELEAISEIINGKRWIHCHSYRQDEILALIRVLDQYGITIGSFQHILEGYKVADAIAKHGGTASSFSDWWAYKIEVIDAIPYAGALMHEQGIAVSFNSDDGELARHMNHEAAKAVRYGGLSEVEALKFVTLNPAKQLRIDEYVGSIRTGKHADLVLWSGNPLSLTSRCEQTWIDGKKYFDRNEFAELAAEQAEMKATLVQKH
ncbi:MAG: amidohydrolase family protein [Pirellulaceae bacterium]